MRNPWLILTTRYSGDIRSPTPEERRKAIRDVFVESIPWMTEEGYAEHGTAYGRYGYDEGPMFVLELSRSGTATFEQWADQDFEQELSPPVSTSVSELRAIELWNALSGGDIDQLRAAFVGGS